MAELRNVTKKLPQTIFMCENHSPKEQFTHPTLLRSQATALPFTEVRGHLHHPHLQMREREPCNVPANALSCHSLPSHTDDLKMQAHRDLGTFLGA